MRWNRQQWRIKHIPSGLYYTPARILVIKDGDIKVRVKSNLSQSGHTYKMIPSLGWIGRDYRSHLWTKEDFQERILSELRLERFGYNNIYEKTVIFNINDWKIEEYNGINLQQRRKRTRSK